ncbi:hypothetical protein [Romboutsia sp.]|uniref:hypothetical protein n=1 Tax=Romboutsia sp. TaxID=1965302 RepID=UPI003F2E19BD
MNNNTYNFDYYMEKLMNHIYEQKLYKLAYELDVNTITNTDSSKFNELIDSIINNGLILDLNVENIIKNYIESSDEGYFFRKSIAIEKNYLYPILYDINGDPKKDYNYTSALITLWKNDMDELFIDEVYSRFTKDSFIKFVKINFNNLLDNIISYVENIKASNRISIKCNNKDDLLDTMKVMILNNSLNLDWAEFLVDMDRLRNEMLSFAGNLSLYSEFEKLEDDTKYCLDKHCKYNSEQLFNVLTKDKNFIWEDGFGLSSK